MNAPLRVLQASDTHLSPNAPFAAENWEAILALAAELRPDLVVHTGDISLDASHDPTDLVHAREQLDRLDMPWVAVPGNHDIGDVHPSGDPVDDARRARFHDVFGDVVPADRPVVRDLGGWRLVGADTQTLVSTLPAADRLWDALATALTGELPTALFLHRPLGPRVAGDADNPERYVTEPARTRLDALLGTGNVRLVASGHVHQWLAGVVDGRHHVWAPAVWAVMPDSMQPVIGDKVLGAVLHTLAGDGSVTSELLIPDTVAQVTFGTDFASPYARRRAGQQARRAGGQSTSQ